MLLVFLAYYLLLFRWLQAIIVTITKKSHNTHAAYTIEALACACDHTLFVKTFQIVHLTLQISFRFVLFFLYCVRSVWNRSFFSPLLLLWLLLILLMCLFFIYFSLVFFCFKTHEMKTEQKKILNEKQCSILHSILNSNRTKKIVNATAVRWR